MKNYFPNLYKLKVGENPIKSLDIFKTFVNFPHLKKLEVYGSDVAKKETYRDELFKMLKDVEIIDKMNRQGDEIDSTVYDDEGDELEDDEELEDAEYEEEEDGELDEEEEYDEEDDEEDKPPKNNKKQRRE